MIKVDNKKTNLYLLLFLICFYVLMLVVNYILGTRSIVDAHEHGFRAGMCGACESCFKPICNSRSGFNIYYLYLSLIIFAFIVGFTNVMLNKSLLDSLLIVLVSSFGYIVLTELLIKLSNTAVLYTHFQEGRQSLFVGAFSILGKRFIILFLSFSVISSFVGNIVAYPLFLLVKRLGR